MEEVWKEVHGFEGKYSVSNLGRIKSNGFYVIPNSERVKPFWKKESILKPWVHGTGYLSISLGRGNRFLAHRLIAITFLPNPNNYKDVNHINGIKDDNRLVNLEWCNRSQNNLHAFKIGLMDHGFKHGGTLSCLNLETGIFYKNAKEAYKYSNYRYSEGQFRRSIKSKRNDTGFILI